MSMAWGNRGSLVFAALVGIAVVASGGARAQQGINPDAPAAGAGVPQDPMHRGGSSGSGGGSSGFMPGKKAPVVLPTLKADPEVWPRLETGAILCRTKDDLLEHLRAVDARRDGTGGALEPAGCVKMRAKTGVNIVSRAGLGRTQVALRDDPKQTGWTDAYLPDRNPGK